LELTGSTFANVAGISFNHGWRYIGTGILFLGHGRLLESSNSKASAGMFQLPLLAERFFNNCTDFAFELPCCNSTERG